MQPPQPGQWAADPYRRHELRYWNGRQWTEHVADQGRQTVDPLPDPQHQAQDVGAGRQHQPASRAVPEVVTSPALPTSANRSGQPDRQQGRTGLTGRTHLLLTALSCGLWILAGPAVYLWQRGSRQFAGLWAAGAATMLVVAIASGGSPSPTGTTATGTRPSAGSSSSGSGVRPLAVVPSSAPAQAPASVAPTSAAPPVTTPPAVRTSTAKASTSTKPPSKTRTTSKPKPSTSKPKPPPTSTGAKDYANCDAMHVDYPHGVGLPGAHDKTAGKPVTTFTVSSALYAANSESDRDGDGIACEKA